MNEPQVIPREQILKKLTWAITQFDLDERNSSYSKEANSKTLSGVITNVRTET